MFIVMTKDEKILTLAKELVKVYQKTDFVAFSEFYNLALGCYLLYVEGSQVELCEMAFEMNWHQANRNLCPSCQFKVEATGEGEACCGHLTFTKPINAAF